MINHGKNKKNYVIFKDSGLPVYMTISFRKLNEKHNDSAAVIWEGQRHLDQERVEQIANFYDSYYLQTNKVPFRGVLIYCEFKGIMHLIDGQHRFHAIRKLMIENKINHDPPLHISIIKVDDYEDIRKEFININLSVPVPVSVMTPNSVANTVVSDLQEVYPRAFTKSVNTRRPYINEDWFKSLLIKNKIAEQNNYDSEAIVKSFIKLNQYYYKLGKLKMAERINGRKKSGRQVLFRMFEKIKSGKNHMYIGMFKDSDWLKDLI